MEALTIRRIYLFLVNVKRKNESPYKKNTDALGGRL